MMHTGSESTRLTSGRATIGCRDGISTMWMQSANAAVDFPLTVVLIEIRLLMEWNGIYFHWLRYISNSGISTSPAKIVTCKVKAGHNVVRGMLESPSWNGPKSRDCLDIIKSVDRLYLIYIIYTWLGRYSNNFFLHALLHASKALRFKCLSFCPRCK